MDALIWLVVLGGTTWVAVDASRLGAQRGRLGGGLLDMGPVAWVVCCLLSFLIAFPCYLATRGRLVTARDAGAQLVPAPGRGAPVGAAASPFAAVAAHQPAPAPPAGPQAPSLGQAQELEDAAQMHRWGHLSDEEHLAAQDRIMRRSGV